MKKTLLFISCLLSFLSNAQSPKFEWAIAMGGIATDIGYSVAISGGNVYTTGMFRHTVDFNPDPIDSFNISAQGLNDVFISKLNDGTLVCLGLDGYVFTRQLDTAWVLVDNSMRMSSVTQLKDGTILGTSQAGWFFRK